MLRGVWRCSPVSEISPVPVARLVMFPGHAGAMLEALGSDLNPDTAWWAGRGPPALPGGHQVLAQAGRALSSVGKALGARCTRGLVCAMARGALPGPRVRASPSPTE